MSHPDNGSLLLGAGQYETRSKRGSRLRYLPWTVLALTLAGSWQLWRVAEHHALLVRQTEFNHMVRSAADRIQQRILNYEQVLQGTRGFIINQHVVERREFHGYVESLQLSQRFPGIQSVSYSAYIPAQHKQQHTALVRKDGVADYAIRPPGVRKAYAPVDFNEPYGAANQRTIGYDNFTSPQRKAAMEKARDLDRPILTAKANLIQEDGQAPQYGYLMFLPVYKAGTAHVTPDQRRTSIAGWLAATFRIKDLMAGMGAADDGGLDIEIQEDSNKSGRSQLSDSGNAASTTRPHLFQTLMPIHMAGQPWLLTAHSLPSFEAGVDRSKANLVGFSALLFSIVLSGITALLVRDRSRAIQLAEGASSELRENKEFQAALQENEQRWKLALEGAGHGVWDWNLQTDEVICSELSKQMRGYTADNYPYRFFSEWGAGVHPEDLPRITPAIQAHLEGQTPAFIFEYRALCRNGEWKWIVTRGMVVERDEQGKPLRMLGTHTDISERRAMQTALEQEKQFSDDIINSLPGNFYVLDIKGQHIRWNKNTEMVTGYTAEEMAHVNALQFFEEGERAAIEQKIREIFERGEGEIEAGLLLKNGKKIPYHFSGRRTVIGGKTYLVGVGLDISARKATEEALRESEERYRDIFNDASYFIFTLDTASRITFVPPILGQLTGYDTDELIGELIGKILTPQSLEKAQQMLAVKMRGETRTTQYEMEMIGKDGRIIPIEVNTSLLYKHGKVVGIQGAGRDITERYRYEQSLRESEEKYRGLFENVGDLAYGTDLDGNFTAVNESLLEVTGYKRDELIDASIGKLLTPENLDLARRMTAAKLAGEKQVTRYELEITDKTGRQIPIEIVSALTFRNGVPIGIQGIGRDIRERKLAEEALRRSEQNYRELMEQAGDAITVADYEGRRYLDVNQAACDMLGYTREEFLKIGIKDLIHPDDVRLTPVRLTELWAGQVVHSERRLRRKDGSYVPVEMSAKMLPDGRLLSIKRNISERLAREAALRKANIKAEEASRAKSEFLANMSHEIRTPMNSVIGMARLALSREADSRQIDYLEKILMSGEHLLGIIDDILDFSKIEAGKLQIENTDFDLRNFMENLASLTGGKAAAKGLEFRVEIDPALPERSRADPLRLRQVLLNFVDNAIKFTSRGEVVVSVKKIEDGNGDCVALFEVRDTGIGMSGAEISMLFRPFQQTDGSITRKYGGTGLGLSISKRLIELMGGEVGITSEPGQGSVFSFRLRLDMGIQDAVQSKGDVADSTRMSAAIRGTRILLAENNIFNQQVAREFLEIAGCVVHVANDGLEALDLLQREHFDCVLMDVQMPVMDGLEATRQIRASTIFSAMPVIAVTANALEGERQACLDAGMNDFITKPVRPETLYAVLAKWLTRQMPPLSVPSRMKSVPDAAQQMAAAIDFEVLAELVGSDREKMRQLAHKFLVTTRLDMNKVEAALEQGDLTQLKQLGHHIKSPAAMMGTARFADLCRALEINTGDLSGARELVQQMRTVLAEIETQVEAQFS